MSAKATPHHLATATTRHRSFIRHIPVVLALLAMSGIYALVADQFALGPRGDCRGSHRHHYVDPQPADDPRAYERDAAHNRIDPPPRCCAALAGQHFDVLALVLGNRWGRA